MARTKVEKSEFELSLREDIKVEKAKVRAAQDALELAEKNLSDYITNKALIDNLMAKQKKK